MEASSFINDVQNKTKIKTKGLVDKFKIKIIFFF